MARQWDPNIETLSKAVDKLGPIADEVVFLGGCATGLLITDPAAALLTQHLRPEIITVYGDTHFEALARKIHPVKDEHGNLEVLQKFWNFKPAAENVKNYPVVPPLLIYADLVATGDARNLETAKMIRERFLG